VLPPLLVAVVMAAVPPAGVVFGALAARLCHRPAWCSAATCGTSRAGARSAETLRRPVARPPLRRPQAAAQHGCLYWGLRSSMLDPAHGCGCHFPPRLAFARRPIPSFATRPAAQEHRLQVGNLLGRSYQSSQVARSPRVSTTLLQDTVSHRSVLSYYCAASQPTLLGRRLLLLQTSMVATMTRQGPPRPGTAFVRRPVRGRRASGAAPARRPGHARLARDAEKSNFNQHPQPGVRSGTIRWRSSTMANVSQASHKLVAWRLGAVLCSFWLPAGQ